MDSSTRWETEALRESGRGRPGVSQDDEARASEAAPRGWVTLREASDATGIPVGTLRKWARREAIPSHLESEGDHTVRLVSLDDVRARADELGRDLAPDPVPDRAGPTISEMAPPPETMIVPIDAWNKIITQLGNLHEAGQQLAEARERAARAETEAGFLRERLAELREEEETPPPPPPEDGDVNADETTATEPRWKAIYRIFRWGRG
jgi:hypothetical protein